MPQGEMTGVCYNDRTGKLRSWGHGPRFRRAAPLTSCQECGKPCRPTLQMCDDCRQTYRERIATQRRDPADRRRLARGYVT